MAKKRRQKQLSQWAVTILASIFAWLILVIFAGTDRAIIAQTAQTLVTVSGLLAAASVALTSFYMGQFMREIPDMLKRLEPSLPKTLEAASPEHAEKFVELMKQGLRAEEAFTVAYLAVFTGTFELWGKAIDTLMESPKQIRIDGTRTLTFLLFAAFLSVLAVLTGSSFALGLAFSLLILAGGELIDAWYRAEMNIRGLLYMGSVVRFFTPQGQQEKKD